MIAFYRLFVFVVVWITVGLAGERIVGIETFSYVMVWGTVAHCIATFVSRAVVREPEPQHIDP